MCYLSNSNLKTRSFTILANPYWKSCDHQQRTQANLVGWDATSICNETNASQDHIA